MDFARGLLEAVFIGVIIVRFTKPSLIEATADFNMFC